MSYTYLQEQGAESSAECFSDIAAYAQSKSTNIAAQSYCNDNETARSHGFQYGMTCEHSTEANGAEKWMRCVEASRVNVSRQQPEVAQLRKTYGRKCSAWWSNPSQRTFLQKMFLAQRLKSPPKTCVKWVTLPKAFRSQRKTWVQTIYGSGIGYLHTPTTKANYAAASMQKWPGCRIFTHVFGKATPTNQEWLMGWPIGWSDLAPLEMDKFQSWLQQHGRS